MSDRFPTSKSSSDSDPLLRAVADGDLNCPDGRMLSALGDLFRRHAQPPNESEDLSADILAKLKDVEHADVNELDAIDAFYDGAGDTVASVPADPMLDRLAGLARSVGPRRVDVTNAVLRRIRASSRLAAVLGTDDERETGDGRSRWRIISAVVAGHVAALLAFAIFQIGFHAGQQEAQVDGTTMAVDSDGNPVDGAGGAVAGGRNNLDLNAPALPPNLPATWGDIRGLGTDLFLLRRFPELRTNARQLFGMQASETGVARSVAWLRTQLDAKTGTFSSGDLPTQDERALATHALGTLALLGEGLGDKAHSTDTRRALDWLRARVGDTELSGDGSGTDHAFAGLSQVTSGLVSLALVEGALLYGDLGLRTVAESTLTTLDRGLPMQAGAAGLGGFTLLALETAQQGGMRVPGRLLQQARRSIARTLPTQDADAGRVGLAAFARYIYGLGGNSSTRQQIGQLGNLLPGTTAGRPDPLGWFFATLALREADGSNWQRWAGALEGQLIPLVQADGHVSADAIRYGETGGDVFATSLVVLNLQAPYRYLPLAPASEK
ncbi:MAG: hypothetical protein H0W78_00305 [Planctomycetes bacterium]|nr:hypothetical protein [Planctomycetota bacterium]